MEADDLKHLALRLAALAERLDARSEAASLRVEQAANLLERDARRLSADASGFTRDVSRSLQQQAGDIVGAGLAGAVEQFNQQIGGAANVASAAAQDLDRERQALRRERRAWLWLGGGALLTGSLLAVGASLYAVHASRGQIARQRVEAALLRAYNSADVTLCGASLCANVDDAAPRQGDRGQYRPVRPRTSPWGAAPSRTRDH